MRKFNQDEFLKEFFDPRDRVDVNAGELQSLIKTNNRELMKKDNEIKRLKTLVEHFTQKSERLNAELLSIKMHGENMILLDLSA